jgi:hypothetical protein
MEAILLEYVTDKNWLAWVRPHFNIIFLVPALITWQTAQE